MEEIKDPWESSEECGLIFSDFVLRPSKTPIMESLNENTKIWEDYKYKEEYNKSVESYFSKKQIYERFIGEHVIHRLRYLNRCIKLEPTNPIFYRNRADYFYSRDQADKFYRDHLKVIEFSNDEHEINMALDLYSGYDFAKIGFEFYQSKEYEKSIKFYKLALKLDVTKLDKVTEKYYFYIAISSYYLERYSDAVTYFRKAIDIDSPNKELDKDIIAEELQCGYQIEDKVLKRELLKVSTGKENGSSKKVSNLSKEESQKQKMELEVKNLILDNLMEKNSKKTKILFIEDDPDL